MIINKKIIENDNYYCFVKIGILWYLGWFEGKATRHQTTETLLYITNTMSNI